MFGKKMNLIAAGMLLAFGFSASADLPATPQDAGFEQCSSAGGALPAWNQVNSGYQSTCYLGNAVEGNWSAVLASNPGHAAQFGALVQCIDATMYRGSVSYTGYLRTENVRGWAGLWMRADAADGTVLAFDNMANRGIYGTTAWSQYQINLFIPNQAVRICYGALLSGDGTIWIDGLQFSPGRK